MSLETKAWVPHYRSRGKVGRNARPSFLLALDSLGTSRQKRRARGLDPKRGVRIREV